MHTGFLFLNLIYETIDNLFSICDQIFVSKQYKAKLRRHGRFCILYPLRMPCALLLSESKYYPQNMILFLLSSLGKGCQLYAYEEGWKYPLKSLEGVKVPAWEKKNWDPVDCCFTVQAS